MGRCPEGRGVPGHSRLPGRRRQPPGVLGLVQPGGGAQLQGVGRRRVGRRDQTDPRGVRRGLWVAEGGRGAATAGPRSQPQARLAAHAASRDLRHPQKAQAPLEGLCRRPPGAGRSGPPRFPARPPGSGVGRGHHLHPNRPGVALSARGARRRLPATSSPIGPSAPSSTPQAFPQAPPTPKRCDDRLNSPNISAATSPRRWPDTACANPQAG